MKKLAAKGPLYAIGKGDSRSTPIHIPELAAIMLEEMGKQENAVVEVGGPEDLTWRETCALCFETQGLPVRIQSAPSGSAGSPSCSCSPSATATGPWAGCCSSCPPTTSAPRTAAPSPCATTWRTRRLTPPVFPHDETVSRFFTPWNSSHSGPRCGKHSGPSAWRWATSADGRPGEAGRCRRRTGHGSAESCRAPCRRRRPGTSCIPARWDRRDRAPRACRA